MGEDRELRQKIYTAHLTRASEFEKGAEKPRDNAPTMTEVLRLRQENAELLGYPNHAELSLSKKMATLTAAEKLIEDLRVASYDTGVKELEELTDWAIKEKGFSEGKLMQWDVPFYAEKMKEAKYAFNEEELKPYFSLPKVEAGLWQLANKLFGIDISEISQPESLGIEKWHPDVRVFEIKRDGNTVAYFFLDAYSRPDTKKGGAWMNEVVGRSGNVIFGPHGRLPVALMVCNQSPPVGDEPSLMTFREVETLFHEFGHALQHMLTQETEGHASGIRLVEWDAVEEPSQFMENWVYHKPTVDELAKHYKTGELIPDELFQKILKAKTYRSASQMLRQLHFSKVDLELHKIKLSPGDEGKKQIFDVDLEVSKTFDVLKLLDFDRFLCGFAHIFAGGYAAGYFSYKWAEVLSADCFAAFEEVGMDNPEEIKKTGRRFADTILGLGGGVAPLEVFKRFRGREPSIDALLRHNGLLSGSTTSTSGKL